MTNTKSLEQLASIFQIAGEQLADIRNWLEYPSKELKARPGFVLLLREIPGLEASFLGMQKLAFQRQRHQAFWRVIQHTLRTLIYHATQSAYTTYESASLDPRGIYAMTLAQKQPAFDTAFEIYRSAHQRITDIQPGLLPYLLLWHDGFGLKGIGNRANHHERVVRFLNAWEIVHLVSVSQEHPLIMRLPEILNLAIKYPLLEDISYMPSTGKFYYYTWRFWREVRQIHPYLLTPDGLSQYLDLQMAFSVLDVSAIREPGSLRDPQQVLDWFELLSHLCGRFSELNDLYQTLSMSEIIQYDLKRLENLGEGGQILLNFIRHDSNLVEEMKNIFSTLPESQLELLQRFLPRIIDYSYFLGVFRLLIETKRLSEIVKMFLEICKYVQQLKFEGWISINLDNDYIKPETSTKGHPLTALLTDDKQLRLFIQSPDLVYSEEYLLTLFYSFNGIIST